MSLLVQLIKITLYLMVWCFWCVSYRAVLQERVPDLQREASSGITGYIRIDYSCVDQSRKVGTNCRQMATVCKPWEEGMKVFKSTREYC